MNELVSMKEIIIRLKAKKEELGLSYGDINERIERNGDFALQKSTLSRIFAEDSENQRFDYEDTIRPLAKALLDIETIEETDTEDVKTLKILLKVKMERIEELERQLEKDKLTYLEKMDAEREAWGKSIDFLKSQITYKDERMNEFSVRINRLLDRLEKKDSRIEQLTDEIIQLKDIKEQIKACPYKNRKGE